MERYSGIERIRIVDNVRTLASKESHGVNDLGESLVSFTKLVGDKVSWALVGGLALAFRTEPRGTKDIDILLIENSELQKVVLATQEQFDLVEKHILKNKKTGIEIELLTPSYLAMDPLMSDGQVREKVVTTAKDEVVRDANVPVASSVGLLVSKLGRFSRQDKADIEKLRKFVTDEELKEFGIPESVFQKYKREFE